MSDCVALFLVVRLIGAYGIRTAKTKINQKKFKELMCGKVVENG